MLIYKHMCFAALAFSLKPARCELRIPSTGLNTAIASDGERPARLSINYIQAVGGPQWDLYILGLREMQSRDQDDPRSFFQIAGIHGRPYIPYNRVEKGPNTSDTGYCFHNEVPFIVWHRPYLALYEQILGEAIQNISSRYGGDDSGLYKSAALSFRIPYWDWAVDARLPPSTTWPQITVQGPNGKETFTNPLYSFTWPDFPLNHDAEWFPTLDDPYFWNYTGTQRLLSNDGKDLNLNTSALRDKVYGALAKTQDFNIMASTSEGGPSLEDPHNDIHRNTGKFMENPIYSSFDPLFWLHHANVDRLFALWQAINYNTTYQTKTADIHFGTFTQGRGTWMTADDPLTPFFQSYDETPHTGRSVASIKPFGYTYPEINDWSMSPERTRQIAIRQVNRLYAPNRTRTPRQARAPPEIERQYYVQVGVERSELPLPCTIAVLLNDDIVAGEMSVMAMPPVGRTTSEIQLNRGIMELTTCVEDKTVVPLLESKLRVEIRKSDGTLISPDTVPSLTIDVGSVSVEIPETDDELPIYGSLTSYPKIGRPSSAYTEPGQREIGERGRGTVPSRALASPQMHLRR